MSVYLPVSLSVCSFVQTIETTVIFAVVFTNGISHPLTAWKAINFVSFASFVVLRWWTLVNWWWNRNRNIKRKRKTNGGGKEGKKEVLYSVNSRPTWFTQRKRILSRCWLSLLFSTFPITNNKQRLCRKQVFSLSIFLVRPRWFYSTDILFLFDNISPFFQIDWGWLVSYVFELSVFIWHGCRWNRMSSLRPKIR